MRTLLSLAALALAAGGATAQQTGESGTYRYGGTYSTVGSASADSCAKLCNQDDVCLAWSFQRATQGLGNASCELKSTIGRSVTNPLMTSGIKPQLATQGQARQRRLPSTDTLLGAPNSAPAISSPPARTVIRNRTASSLPAAPSALATQPAPAAQPAPIRQAPTHSTPVNPAPVQAAPLRQRETSRTPVNTAPVRQVTPPSTPSVSSAPVRQVPQAAAPLNAAPARKVIPATENPALPAPVRQAAPVQPAPTQKVLSRSEIDAIVTKSERPAGSVLRDAPPPQVSFEPLEAAPAPSRQAAAPPVTPVAPKTAAEPTAPAEVIRFPTKKRTASAAPRTINTVPAGSIPEAPATPNKPYENLRKRTYPEFSVNSGTVLTGEELAQQEALADKTIDHVDIDSVDLATDIGEPLVQNQVGNNRQTVPSGGGAGS